MTKQPYAAGPQGPTLLYIFQRYYLERGAASEGYVREHAEAAAARLTDEITAGRWEVIERALKPGWRLQPKKGPRLPRLVADVVNRIKTESKTDFYDGLPRLDVIE